MARRKKSAGLEVTSSTSRPTVTTHGWFRDSHQKLSPPIGEQVLAKLQIFAEEWVSVESEAQLDSTWQLKTVGSDAACKKRKLWQMRPTHDTRAWLWTDPAANLTHLLFVWHNSDKGMENRIIKKLCGHIAEKSKGR